MPKLNAYLAPLLRRLGTLLAGYLIGQGVPHELAQALGVLAAALAGVALDLYLSNAKDK